MTNYTKKLNAHKGITTESTIIEVIAKMKEYNKQIQNWIGRNDIDLEHFEWLQGGLQVTFKKLEKDFEARKQNHETVILFHVEG